MANKYQHPYKHYAEFYGVSLPSIKRYAAAGRPLDDPDAMGEYLSNRGRKPDSSGDRNFRDSNEDEESPDDKEARLRLFSPGVEFYEGEGLGAEIRRLTVLAREAAKRLGDAMASRDARERQNRTGEYLQMLEALRKIEKEQPGILLQNEKAILISEVEEGVTRLLLAIIDRLKTIPTRAMQTLVGLTPAEIRDDLERELDQALEPIRKCEWLPEEHRPAPVAPPPVETESTPKTKRKATSKRKVPKSGTSKAKTPAKRKSRKK